MVLFAIALVRAWTRLYTCRMNAALRDSRRSEIDSDLWEFQEDQQGRGASGNAVAAQTLARLVLGVRDDLLWRLEHIDPGPPLRRSAWVVATGTALLVAAFLLFFVLGDPDLPPLPPAPSLTPPFHSGPPPPPPPPPPRLDVASSQAR